ncbi:MAG: histidine phosphatase family protein [Nanoarchaeota archaeon]
MNLIIVRHAESLANSKNMSQANRDGWSDTSLTEKGLIQAKAVAQRLKDEDIEIIYCSTLKRAKETAQEINKFHNVEIKYDSRLIDDINDEPLEKFISRCNESFKEIEKFGKNAIIVAHGSVCLTLLAFTTGSRDEGEKIINKYTNKYDNTCVSFVENVNNEYKIKLIACRKHLENGYM